MEKYFNSQLSALLLTVFVTLFSFTSQSQIELQKQKSEFWQQVEFGGTFGITFGNNFFGGTIAPSAVYRFNEMFATGVALNLSYSKGEYSFENIVVGGSVLGLFNPISQIQLSAEFEQLYVNRTDLYPICAGYTCYPLDEKYWYPALYLGAGYNTGPVTMGIRFDVLYDSNRSTYASSFNPFVRVYF